MASRPGSALVTGAARRVGRALALELGRLGYAVAVHYRRSAEDAAETVAAIRAAGGTAEAFDADLAREAEVRTLVPRVSEALGPLTCLVNNASRFERDEPGSTTRASWDAHLETNLRAPFVLIQDMAAALPSRTPTAANVVNLLDQRVWRLTPHFTSYTVSKVGLWGLTQSLALALAPRVRVNAIGPGPALPSARQSAAQFDAQCAGLPLRRGTTPDEIAAALRFILATPSLTGQMIALDGGQHLGWSFPALDRQPDE
ncbi:MAG TPA: SDR family oxidoreductase [Candidatus Sulfotelmatobacter sp.]|nr:SDR family oxidoreductase [Candidatus Sulfotelmatobacter sp.]